MARKQGFITDFVQCHDSKDKLVRKWANYFKTADYVDLFDFVTFFIRDQDCSPTFMTQVAESLEKPFSPYRLDVSTRTIIPALSEEQALTLRSDLKRVFQTASYGAKTHLQAALDALNRADHQAVVRESINAVESAVRDFTKDPNAILSRALKKLVDELGVNRALSDAFEKLYAYTSDEKCIRHALVFDGNEKVGFDEAIFFVSACSAFVAFLGQKAKDHGASE